MIIPNKNIYICLFCLFFVIITEVMPQGKIIGVIRDKDYHIPIGNVIVSLSNIYGKETNEITTDATGFFAFNDLKYDLYRLEISSKGYSGYIIKNIRLSEKKQEFIFDTIKISSKSSNILEIVLKDETPEINLDVEKSDSFLYGKIIGSVRDRRDYTPIRDASVMIFRNEDSVRYAGTGTDATGFFAFNNLENGKYKIEVSFIGYTTYRVKDIVIDENIKEVYLDTIRLATSSYRTDEITVQDEKPLIEFNDDKKVFNIDKIISTKGGTAIDALRKLPMIEVDANDNISLRGSKNVVILIDNKPMKFASLKQIPADAIKNVEIITNPSAKYESEGITGIINIVMKENDNRELGYNGYLYTGFRDNKSYNTGLGLDMKKSKFSFFINGGLGDFRYKNENTGDVTYFKPQSFFKNYSNGDGSGKYYYAGLGTEYELKKSHSIGIDAYINKYNYDNNSTSRNYNYDSLYYINSLYDNSYLSDGNWDSYSMSLYYNGKFGKLGKELNFDLTYMDSKSPGNSNQSIQYLDSLLNPVKNPSKQKDITNLKNYNLKVQLDYTNPFNDKTKFETGYKGIFRVNDNDFSSDTMNYVLNKFIRNEDVTNHFKLSENINAIYGTFSHKIMKFRFKLGLRIEHTYAKGELITNSSEFKKDYLDVFPTISISQKFGMSHELQLSYSRRITRPNNYRLNPFVRKRDMKFITFGNSELNPEYSDSYELSYMFISNIINLTPMVFYRRSTDVISNYSYLTDSNITVNTYVNSGSGYSYGMDFIISSHAFKWWNLNSTFSFYNSKYDDGLTNDYSGEEGFSWKANIRSFFTFGELFNLEIYYDYTGKRINPTGFNQPSHSLDISVNKSFFGKKLTIGIRGEDIFKTRKWGSETNGTGLKSIYEYKYDSRGVYLNLSYSFGNTKDYYKKSKNTKKNENEKSDANEEGNK